MTQPPPDPAITEALLVAYADGRLTAGERARVEAHLRSHPEVAAEIANWQRQNEAFAALYAPAVREPVPARLDPHRIAARLAGEGLRRWRLAAAALVLVTLGATLGWAGSFWFASADRTEQQLLTAAITAHTLYVNEKRHAVEVAASEEDHLVNWLSSRIRTRIHAPDLTAAGFALVGGRLLPASPHPDAGPAAQLMYENGAGERLTMYLTGPRGSSGPASLSRATADLDAHYWATDRLTCTIVGPIDEATMATIAAAALATFGAGDAALAYGS